MADNILEIGARVVLDGLKSGMDSAQAVVAESTNAMGAEFVELHSITFGAVDGMVESLGELGASAQATAGVVTESSVAAGAAVNTMAERIVEAAEKAKIGTAGISSAFSGMATLLGAGLVAGFAASFIDETEKAVLELGHLSEKTGIAIETLAGLQVATREIGVDFSAVETGLIRLERAQALATAGGKSQAEALHRIGLSVEEIRNLTPEELLMKIAAAMQNTSSSADKAAAAIALFGKGGAALIPIFNEYGGTLESVTKANAELAGVTEEAYQESLKYTKATADLGFELRKLAIETVPLVTTAIHGFKAAFAEASAGLGQITIRLVEAYADMKALLDPTLSVSQVVTAFSDNSKLAALNLRELNRETAVAVNNALGLKAAQGDDPWGMNALQAMLDKQFPTKRNVPEDEPKAKGSKKDLADEAEKAAEERIQAIHKEFEEQEKFAQEKSDLEEKINNDALEQQTKRQGTSQQRKEAHLLKQLDLEKKAIEQEFALHQITAEKEAALLIDLENRRYQIEREALEDRRALEEKLDPNNPVKLAEMNAKIEALADKHEATLTAIHRRAVEARAKDTEKLEKLEEKSADRMSKNMVRFFDSTILHSKNFNDALTKMFLNVEKAFLNSLVQMLAKYIAHKVAKLGVAAATQQTEVAITAQGTAETEGIENVAAFKSIFRDAAKGAAHAFEKVMAAVPFPTNVVLAPLAAAGTFAAIAAFGGNIGSAEGGWDIPAGINPITQLHQREMVLPAGPAQTLRDLSSRGIGGGDQPIHLHFPTTIHANDTQGFERSIGKFRRTIGNTVTRQIKSGQINIAKLVTG